MIEFFLFYLFSGLVINQIVALVSTVSYERHTGTRADVNLGQIVVGAFSWPLVLWMFISSFNRKEE